MKCLVIWLSVSHLLRGARLCRLEKASNMAIQGMRLIPVSFLIYNIYFLIYRIRCNLIKQGDQDQSVYMIDMFFHNRIIYFLTAPLNLNLIKFETVSELN
jgi:hypothetical protein